MMRRAVLLSLAILMALPAIAFAAREDDFNFAQGLVGLKYYDLAKEEFEKIISDSGRPGDQRANGELGLALLLKAQASDMMLDTTSETEATLALFDEAESRFDKFLSNNPGHKKRTDARFEVGLLLQAKGTFLSGRAEKEPDKAESLKAAAESGFDQATDLFKGVAEALEGEADNLTETELEGERGEMITWNSKRARFYEAVCHYNKGILYAEDGAEREGTLERAIELLTDFVWDNEDNILGAYAYLYLGLCKKALDLPDEALEFLKVASSGYPIPDPKYASDFRNWTDLYLQGYFKLGEYCNDLGQVGEKDYRDIAIQQFKEMDEKIAMIAWDRKFGHLALLQWSRALMGLQEFNEAMDLATRVSLRGEELAPTSEWGAATAYMANRLLNEIIGEAGSRNIDLSLPPDVLLKAAMGKKTSREWGYAVRAFQEVVKSAKTAEAIKSYAIPAWMEIGECYYREDKYLEAFFAYDAVVKGHRTVDEKLAGDAAYYRYRAATALYASTKDPKDEELKKSARSSFASEFPQHPRSIDLQYYEGADYIADGDAFSTAGEKEKATASYNLALERLNGVKKSSILYAKARARIGEIYYKTDKTKEALEMFDWVEKYVADRDNVTTDQERNLNRLQARALSTYWNCMCQVRRKRFDKVLEVLADYETKFADENVKNFHGPVKFERIRALIRTEDIPGAEKEALILRDQDPESPRTALAFYLIGMAYFDEAAKSDEAAKAGDAGEKQRWLDMLTKAADYFTYYLTRKAEPSAGDYQTLGIWFYKLGDLEQAAPNLEKSLLMMSTELELLDPKDPRHMELLKQIEGITVMLSEILLKNGDYAKAGEFFENLLIPDKGARKRVEELLEQQEHTLAELQELMDKIRAVPSFMEGYARVLRELGKPEDCLRALTLLRLLTTADRKQRYTTPWWEWQYLTFQIWLDLGVNHRVRQALENIIAKYDEYEGLGVLERSGRKKELTTIKLAAEKALRK